MYNISKLGLIFINVKKSDVKKKMEKRFQNKKPKSLLPEEEEEEALPKAQNWRSYILK
jgi:hypothetical protein